MFMTNNLLPMYNPWFLEVRKILEDIVRYWKILEVVGGGFALGDLQK